MDLKIIVYVIKQDEEISRNNVNKFAWKTFKKIFAKIIDAKRNKKTLDKQ